MRKINAILGPALIVLLLIHIISGAFQLFGVIPGGMIIRTVLSYILLALTGIHAVIGVILTVQTLRCCRQEGKTCFKNNQRFWLSRISGFAMLLLIVYHVLVFTGESGAYFRLQAFGPLQLAAHVLLAAALFLHLATNIRPLYIALGIESRTFVKDTMVVLAIVILVCAAAFVVYYLRWNVQWRYGS